MNSESITAMVRDVAETYADGRLVSVLEGGYDVYSLADSVERHLKQLLLPETYRSNDAVLS